MVRKQFVRSGSWFELLAWLCYRLIWYLFLEKFVRFTIFDKLVEYKFFQSDYEESE
jgi:hypothetical protein